MPGIFAIYDEQVLHGIATFETVVKTEGERQAWFEAHPPGGSSGLGRDGWGWGARGWVGGVVAVVGASGVGRGRRRARCMCDKAGGKGVGRELMKELIARAVKETPIRVLVARIAQPSPGSVALHSSLGFTAVGTLRRCGEKFGRILDVLIMDLHLDS